MKHEHHVITEADGELHVIDIYEADTARELVDLIVLLAAARMPMVARCAP